MQTIMVSTSLLLYNFSFHFLMETFGLTQASQSEVNHFKMSLIEGLNKWNTSSSLIWLEFFKLCGLVIFFCLIIWSLCKTAVFCLLIFSKPQFRAMKLSATMLTPQVDHVDLIMVSVFSWSQHIYLSLFKALELVHRNGWKGHGPNTVNVR